MFGICSVCQVGQGSNSQPGHGPTFSSRIPQLDGPIPDPYDDALSTPNVSICFLFLLIHIHLRFKFHWLSGRSQC